MHGEAPEFKRCCFCLPLRRGLIAWGYVKLVVNLLTIAYAISTMGWWFVWPRSFDAGDIAICTVIMTLLLIDLSFIIVFIVASHKKSVKMLKVSYIYNMVWLGFVLLINGFQLYIQLYYVYMWGYGYRMHAIYNLVFSAGVAFLLIFTQIYLILLIRSEMEKLRKQSLEMQFTNHLASGEPQCTLQACADQSEGKKVVQDCCTNEKQAVQDRQEANERGMS